MKVDVVLGLQWGDEGKGKIVDVLTPNYKVISRFQGGPNAGHTLIFEGQKYVLHTIPSGIFRENSVNIIGNGVVVDPVILSAELAKLKQCGKPIGRLIFSKKAHLILPTHRILDAASEKSKGSAKIGSTLKGIGPTYMDKTGRNGLRVGDIISGKFQERYEALKSKHIQLIKQMDYDFDVAEYEKEWFEGIEVLKQFEFVDSEHYLSDCIEQNVPVLAEGAQGSLLDIDFGTYPFVTSSNTVCAGVCIGLGVAPRNIGEVFGIFKAYCTRVGSGPFPTELFDDHGQKMADIGREYGSTTGRRRRCGWLDLVALKYAVMVNGVTQLIMMKSDVLNEFETIKVATSYKMDGELIENFPYEISDNIEPQYVELKGWNCDINSLRAYDQFPVEFKEYVEYIEKFCGVPIKIVSAGPDREETVLR